MLVQLKPGKHKELKQRLVHSKCSISVDSSFFYSSLFWTYPNLRTAGDFPDRGRCILYPESVDRCFFSSPTLLPTLLNLRSSEEEAENTERPRGTALVDWRIVSQGIGRFEVRAATDCAAGEGAGTDEVGAEWS